MNNYQNFRHFYDGIANRLSFIVSKDNSVDFEKLKNTFFSTNSLPLSFVSRSTHNFWSYPQNPIPDFVNFLTDFDYSIYILIYISHYYGGHFFIPSDNYIANSNIFDLIEENIFLGVISNTLDTSNFNLQINEDDNILTNYYFAFRRKSLLTEELLSKSNELFYFYEKNSAYPPNLLFFRSIFLFTINKYKNDIAFI